MNQRYFLSFIIVCLLLGLTVTPALGQRLPQDFSLDDDPTTSQGAPTMPPYCTAEDEYGLGLPANMVNYVGPSPSLAIGPFLGADILHCNGGTLTFSCWSLMHYVDSLSLDHGNIGPAQIQQLWLRFSIDRAAAIIATILNTTQSIGYRFWYCRKSP